MISSRKKTAVFLDRDGVINRVIFRDGKPCSPRHIAEFELCDGVKKAVESLKTAGLTVFVVTNQPDISRGLIPGQTLQEMTDFIQTYLGVQDIAICAHDDADACPCRKPKPGLLLDLANKWGIDLPSSFIIGDTQKDMGAGRSAGLSQCFLIDALYNAAVPCDRRFPDLESATAYVAKIFRKEAP